MSGTTGHHYANPTNHFYRCLHQSGRCLYVYDVLLILTLDKLILGFTTSLLSPTEDYTLPDLYSVGLVSKF